MKPGKGGRPTDADKLALLERRKRAAAAYVRGAAQWEIARQENVSRQAIAADLAAIRKDWRASTLVDFDARIDQELAKLDAVEAEAWAGWERSKRDAETRQAKTVKTPAGKDKDGKLVFDERTEASKREEGQCGDPRFLAEARACVKQRCELLGLIVNKVKAEHSGKDGGPIQFVEVVRPGNGNEATDGSNA